MMSKKELIRQAIKASKMAYSPYSKFKVGAAILTKSGKVYLGANIENVAYSVALCAERVAISHAYMDGIRKKDIIAIAVVADLPQPVSPCGECRQVMSEMFKLNTKVYLGNLKGKMIETTVEGLLPLGFESLSKKLS